MIKITEKYFLDADSHNCMLKEKYIVKDKKSKNYGQEDYIVIGYYPTPEGALSGLVKNELKKFIAKDTINDIKDLIDKIEKLNKLFKDKLEMMK